MSILAFSCSGSLCLLQLLSFVSMVMSQRSLDGEPTFPYAHCPPGSNNTASTKFMDNLGHLFKGNLYDESGKSLYYNTTDGEPPDKVYSNYICRFDFSPETCQNCVDNAINSVVERCNGTKEAIVWYPTCMVRYSDRNFFSTLETVPSIYSWSAANITQPFQFVKILNQTFADLIAMAPSNPSKYAIKEGDISDFERLYSLAQCTQDLSTEDCRACLNTAFDRVTEDNMQGKQGGRVLIPSCFVRYELFRFYEEPEVVGPPGPISPPNKGRRRKKNSSARIQIAIITASVVIVIAWKLWCEGEALELMDPVVMHSCDAVELMNCIHIGLLCVQEDPTNRPTMSSVVVMLASDSIQLPQPTQPAFSVGRVVENCAQSSSDGKVCSINEVTVSNVLPR
ncbi:hypothetical protein JRO89_XS06G0175700 [Xanthoceras sorbifolium]|uniref:Gnk2-homologous domain-containing protein n=1 Tax=Xanthoceras sorbifolium TaxID=99658 RepID=A0ABQ8HYW1_9ROSI|nr:hypothetical protein JRO89_XS06G0175700 [Xanthoceras sorbifolium]